MDATEIEIIFIAIVVFAAYFAALYAAWTSESSLLGAVFLFYILLRDCRTRLRVLEERRLLQQPPTQAPRPVRRPGPGPPRPGPRRRRY